MSLAITALVVLVALVPPLAVVGAWVGAVRLGRRPGVPRFVTWVAFALGVPGALLVASSLVSAVLGWSIATGEAVEPSQKARHLAEGISEAMNSGAAGFLFALVALLWLGFWGWKVGRKGAGETSSHVGTAPPPPGQTR